MTSDLRWQCLPVSQAWAGSIAPWRLSPSSGATGSKGRGPCTKGILLNHLNGSAPCCAEDCADGASQQRPFLLAVSLKNVGLQAHFDICDSQPRAGHYGWVTATNPAALGRGALHVDGIWEFPGILLPHDARLRAPFWQAILPCSRTSPITFLHGRN
jgi:hypothetical protein